ncbi:hypothetical protein EJN44_13730 [Shigella dysenteriae]|nr:hypothetical protein [Shigella dysenteriae]EFX6398296.1 hypothetical protein [Shigella boydii]EFX6528137.1 hypothetical protein [Shigella dysenteriae]
MDKLRSGINSRRKAEKTPQSAAFGIVCYCLLFLAGCGVNALSGLQKHANSIYCRDHVGLIKRSASGNLAFETVCLFLAGCDANAPSGIAKLKITRLLSPRYHAAQRCG